MRAVEARLVALPCEAGVEALIADVESAAARAAKADHADRADIVRFETLSVQLEQQAVLAWSAGAASAALPAAALAELPGALRPGGADPPASLPASVRAEVESWRQRGCAAVAICLPFAPGVEGGDRQEREPPPPAERWESEQGSRGRQAVEERFEAQLQAALGGAGAEGRNAISPSGVQNTVVTEALRRFVDRGGSGGERVDAPVEYRDGSQAENTFPLRALTLSEELGEEPELSLRMALLSIRHTEMDAVVDGAWLRNAEISRKRPAAQTDDLVYEISRAQIAELTRDGSRRLRLQMFQTGLETAVVGFYRAVTMHLLEHPGSLCVVPMYHQAPPRPKKRGRAKKGGVVQSRAPFRPGTGWAA
ncbi:MAG TPA: hypothetical protein VHP56_07145 [Solirubrobacterales bacterium]|jgi:hypothetical protein|nr:hypothetical protein [Solirubrobacterales bacterium]